MLIATHLAHLGSCLPYTIDVECFALNLAKLDAETAQLNLGVDASQVFDISIVVPAAQVASVVHPHGTSPAVFLNKGAIDKRLGGAFWQSPVATSHLNAGKAQLACSALRHKVTCGIDDEVPVVCHALANGDVLHTLAWSDAIVGSVVGTLSWAVHINNLDVVTEHTIHLLASTSGETNRQVVKGVE